MDENDPGGLTRRLDIDVTSTHILVGDGWDSRRRTDGTVDSGDSPRRRDDDQDASLLRGRSACSSRAASARTAVVHLELLELERERLDQLISTIDTTLRKLKGGEQLMLDEVFDGFDHPRHRDEVVERWGGEAWHRADRWWSSLSDEEKQQHQQTPVEIAADFAAALRAGEAPASEDVQAIADRHVQWLSGAVTPSKGYLLGLGEMYVTDPRFAAKYEKHGEGTAAFVREAVAVYAERNFV